MALCAASGHVYVLNQGDTLLSGQRLDVAKLVLTYVVPYIVSTYGAVSYHLKSLSGDPRGEFR